MAQERSESLYSPLHTEATGEVSLFPYEQLARTAVQTFGDKKYIRRAIEGITLAARSVFADPDDSAFYARRAIEEALDGASERRIESWRAVVAEKFTNPEPLEQPKMN